MEKVEQIKLWVMEHLLVVKIGLALFCGCVIFGSALFVKSSEVTKESDVSVDSSLFSEISSEKDVGIEKKEIPTEKMVVDVKGAVLNPGVYSVKAEMRLVDAIELAGGFLKDSDKEVLNLSLRLQDQMVIYVPVIGEEVKNGTLLYEDNPKLENEPSETEDKLNINQAEANELQTLTGIGAKKAQTIVDYRQENGSFQKIEELKEITGIGEKIFEGLKEQITVG